MSEHRLKEINRANNISGGIHLKRSMMSSELAILLDYSDHLQNPTDYEKVIIEDNILKKSTTSGRNATFKYLREHYTFSQSDNLFLVLRRMTKYDPSTIPLMACLYSIHRDTIFRCSADYIFLLRPGMTITSQNIADFLNPIIGDRYSFNTLRSLSQNIGASWTQSGHLVGKVKKTRSKVKTTWSVAAFAFVIGFLNGHRGTGLFDTIWTRVLDVERQELEDLAFQASRHGVFDFKASGDVIEFDFGKLLPESVLGGMSG